MESLHSVRCLPTQHLFESKLNSSIDFEKKYLSANLLEHHDNEDILRQDIARVNGNLDALGLHRLGDLFACSPFEIDKTLAVYMDIQLSLKELLDRRQKELDFRNHTAYKIRKVESERDELITQKDKWGAERQALEQERDRLIRRAKEIDLSYKDTM